MMKIIIFVGILALAVAVPAPSVTTANGRHYGHDEVREKIEPIAILKSAEHKSNDGSFTFAYEAADGSFRQETGRIVNPGTDEQELEVSGSYRYFDANGDLVEVKYTAGRNGFLPVGSIIPIEISTGAKVAAAARANES